MALDHAAVLQVLEAMKSAGVDDRVQVAAETIYQALIDAELTSVIGAGPWERTESRSAQRNGLNSAIHTIAITRMRCCATTKDYVARRRTEGKSSRQIQRCLKRYIARELYRALNVAVSLTGQTSAAPEAP